MTHKEQGQQNTGPVITVFAVGGAGGNAVNNMVLSRLEGVRFISANTDAQALEHSLADVKIRLGDKITNGLGAGAKPDIGAAAAEEAIGDILEHIEGSNIVFITAGMGGGTGTGAAPIVARTAKEKGILTIGVVTKPFNFEGIKRMEIAEEGIAELEKYVDTLIVIPNQNLFKLADANTTFANAFKMADNVLYSGIRGITDLMMMPGLINLDFADVKTVMSEMGKAMMGSGEAEGPDRSIKAAEAAISNPLLAHSSMKGARGVLINITGGSDLTLFEVDDAANRIREEIKNEDANIIFGSTFNEEMTGKIRVSVVATGIELSPYVRIKPVRSMAKKSENNAFEEDQVLELESQEEDMSLDQRPQEKKSLSNLVSDFITKMGQFAEQTTANPSSRSAAHEEIEIDIDIDNIDKPLEKSTYDIPAFLRRKEKSDSQ